MYVKKKRKKKTDYYIPVFRQHFTELQRVISKINRSFVIKKNDTTNIKSKSYIYIYIYHLTNDKLILEWTSAIPKTLTLL